LNNLIEQDHRGIKFQTRPMLVFKSYNSAATTVAGIELLYRIRNSNSPSVVSASKTKPRL